MKFFLGFGMVIAAVLLGLYVGVWVCFVGGIFGILEVINGMIAGSGIDSMLTAISVAKIMFAGVAGYLAAAFLALPGVHLMEKHR